MRRVNETLQNEGQQMETAQHETAKSDIPQGLYRESFEHDNCGIGAIVNIKGVKSHSTVAGALKIVEP